MSTGRTSEPRTVTVTRTSGSTAVTGPADTFDRADAGRPLAGAGIPAGATILSVASSTAATLSANAGSTGTGTVTIGSAGRVELDGQLYGFTGWSPESDTEAQSYTLASVNAGASQPEPSQRGRG